MSRDPISLQEFVESKRKRAEAEAPRLNMLAVCSVCGDYWDAVFPAGAERLECPHCGAHCIIPNKPVLRLLKPKEAK